MSLVKMHFLTLIAALIGTTLCSNQVPDGVRRAMAIPCPLNATSPLFLEYFLDQQMPTGLPYGTAHLLYICQTLPEIAGVSYYSTLFDEGTGIAVLSAYTVNNIQAKGIGLINDRAHSWRTNKDISRQGTNGLYLRSGLDKGHLNPVKINSFDKNYVKATFSYTNAVPQYLGWNRGRWADYEGYIAEYVQRVCAGQYGGTMYLLTGTSNFHIVVGTNPPTQGTIGSIEYFPGTSTAGKIVRPNSLWTAACCVWMVKKTKKAKSIAVMGNNDSNKGKVGTTSMKLTDLENILDDKTSPQGVNLFPSLPACRDNSQLLYDETTKKLLF